MELLSRLLETLDPRHPNARLLIHGTRSDPPCLCPRQTRLGPALLSYNTSLLPPALPILGLFLPRNFPFTAMPTKAIACSSSGASCTFLLLTFCRVSSSSLHHTTNSVVCTCFRHVFLHMVLSSTLDNTAPLSFTSFLPHPSGVELALRLQLRSSSNSSNTPSALDVSSVLVSIFDRTHETEFSHSDPPPPSLCRGPTTNFSRSIRLHSFCHTFFPEQPFTCTSSFITYSDPNWPRPALQSSTVARGHRSLKSMTEELGVLLDRGEHKHLQLICISTSHSWL